MQVGVNAGMVEIWSDNERLAVHPRAHNRGQRLTQLNAVARRGTPWVKQHSNIGLPHQVDPA